MTKMPQRWNGEQLALDAGTSAALFRDERLAASGAWDAHVTSSRTKFNALFEKLGDLAPGGITDERLIEAYGANLGETLRYLAGPPISDDDLEVLADVESMTPSVLVKHPDRVRKVFEVIERVIDEHRFPWIKAGASPTPEQRHAALLASSVLLAAQRIATARRSAGKEDQETLVKDYLRKIGFAEATAVTIRTLVNGPQAGQFCGECKLGERKADVIVRLHDTRLMAIECKVSNSAVNSVKRLNNDAAVKAEYWLKTFGTVQVVPAAVLAGVFNALNLTQAQDRGLALFWSHDIGKLGEFIESAR